jgi:hypothetical protein
MASEVRVVLMGGLGNQLFQYFAGSIVREFMRIPLVVDHSALKFHHHHSDSNLSELRIYNPDSEKFRSAYPRLRRRWDSLLRKASSASKNFMRLTGVVSTDSFDLLKLSKKRQTVKLRGYFQSIQVTNFALENKSKIEFELLNESSNFLKVKAMMPREFVSIHVRMGDYLEKKSIHRTLDQTYYSRALDALSEKAQNLPKIIFSDDISRARKILPEKFDYFDVSQFKLTAPEELILMSYGSAHIIANSTYSFWGALLSKSSTEVVAPRYWLKSGTEEVTFLPQDWNVI